MKQDNKQYMPTSVLERVARWMVYAAFGSVVFQIIAFIFYLLKCQTA